MMVAVRAASLSEIATMRKQYRKEMNCQIVHDSIHTRPGWTEEYVLEVEDVAAGYGSVAVAGPWRETHALYEFFVLPEHRRRVFDLFAALLPVCGARVIETQSNARLLTVMLHTFAGNVRAEAILFEDAFHTSEVPEGASFRAATAEDVEALRQNNLSDDAPWVATMNGEIAGAGGVLHHYNRPYGDIYMAVAEAFRRKGLGAYLVQALKAVCRANGGVPAARCNVANLASRKTLQRAGLVPCGNILAGDLGV